MTSRVLAGVAAAWLLLYLVVYVWVIRGEQGDTARWYVGLVLLAASAALVATAGVVPLATTTTALILTALATLVALLSIGLLLVPALVVLTVALLHRPRSRRLDQLGMGATAGSTFGRLTGTD